MSNEITKLRQLKRDIQISTDNLTDVLRVFLLKLNDADLLYCIIQMQLEREKRTYRKVS